MENNFIDLNDQQMEVLNACKQCFKSIELDFENTCAKLIRDREITRETGNWLDIYPIVSAILLDEVTQMLNGASSYDIVRSQKRKTHKYMKYKLSV